MAFPEHRREFGNVGEDAVADEEEVRAQEDEEDRQEHLDRFLHPPEVQHHEHRERRRGRAELVGLPLQRQEGEDGVGSRRDGDGDREDVVHHERGTGHDAEFRPQELRGHHIPAAAGGEVLDEQAVGERDHRHRHHHQQGERQGQVLVAEDGPECLVGAVGRGGEAVGAQPYPGEEGHQRDVVEDGGVCWAAGLAEEEVLERAPLSARGEMRFAGHGESFHGLSQRTRSGPSGRNPLRRLRG